MNLSGIDGCYLSPSVDFSLAIFYGSEARKPFEGIDERISVPFC